ncbi:MAG: hypothetical protein FJ194_14635 [Gammaproteobacteria bacterium]|nr:hypothetical protein [Gammaproteobacteria bacterium]
MCVRWYSGVSALVSLLVLPVWAEGAWKSSRDVSGVTVQSRDTSSKYKEHRGSVSLCGDLQTVLLFVADVDQLPQWVPNTPSARKLEESASGIVYHVVTKAPWPYKPRDMIYALEVDLQGSSARVTMKGLPERIPPEAGMYRMKAADGLWTFQPKGDQLEVTLRLWIDPGGGPAALVNRRAGTTVGRMLANLGKKFTCSTQTMIVSSA